MLPIRSLSVALLLLLWYSGHLLPPVFAGGSSFPYQSSNYSTLWLAPDWVKYRGTPGTEEARTRAGKGEQARRGQVRLHWGLQPVNIEQLSFFPHRRCSIYIYIYSVHSPHQVWGALTIPNLTSVTSNPLVSHRLRYFWHSQSKSWTYVLAKKSQAEIQALVRWEIVVWFVAPTHLRRLIIVRRWQRSRRRTLFRSFYCCGRSPRRRWWRL